VAIAALLIVPKLDLFKSKKGPAADAPRGPGKMAVEAITVRPSRLDNKLIVTGSVQANESLELNHVQRRQDREERRSVGTDS
jgi:hypothetical protein